MTRLMGEAIGQMLTSAVGVAISPMPLVAVVLMLATPRGRSNGAAFTGAFVGGIAVVGTTVLLLGSGASAATTDGPAGWVLWLKLLLGGLFLVLALNQWRGRPREGEPAETPGWMRAIDGFTPAKAATFGLLFSAVNPKNLVLTIGAAVGIASGSVGAGGKATLLILFVVIASLCTSVPLIVYLTRGESAAHTLDSWKSWMIEHNRAIMIVLFVVLGVKYVGDAAGGLIG